MLRLFAPYHYDGMTNKIKFGLVSGAGPMVGLVLYQHAIVAILKGESPDLSWIEQASQLNPVLLGCAEYSVELAACNWNVIDPIKLAANDLVDRWMMNTPCCP